MVDRKTKLDNFLVITTKVKFYSNFELQRLVNLQNQHIWRAVDGERNEKWGIQIQKDRNEVQQGVVVKWTNSTS